MSWPSCCVSHLNGSHFHNGVKANTVWMVWVRAGFNILRSISRSALCSSHWLTTNGHNMLNYLQPCSYLAVVHLGLHDALHVFLLHGWWHPKTVPHAQDLRPAVGVRHLHWTVQDHWPRVQLESKHMVVLVLDVGGRKERKNTTIVTLLITLKIKSSYIPNSWCRLMSHSWPKRTICINYNKTAPLTDVLYFPQRGTALDTTVNYHSQLGYEVFLEVLHAWWKWRLLILLKG